MAGVYFSWLHFGLVNKFWTLIKDWKSVIVGVWVAPGALETLQEGGGRSTPPFARVSGAPGAAQTPKMADFQSLKDSRIC